MNPIEKRWLHDDKRTTRQILKYLQDRCGVVNYETSDYLTVDGAFMRMCKATFEDNSCHLVYLKIIPTKKAMQYAAEQFIDLVDLKWLKQNFYYQKQRNEK
jgi:hypothetical protein